MMQDADITLYSVDQMTCRLVAEREIREAVAKLLSFYADGYQFNPLYKRGLWDGRINLMDFRTATFSKTMIPDVIDFAIEHDYTLKFEKKADFRPALPFDPTWIERWAEYAAWKPRQHQIEYINEALERQNSLVLAPTSSGKSYIIYMICRRLSELIDGDILITVPSTMLVDQMYDDFADYVPEGSTWQVEDNVSKIFAGQDKYDLKRITVSTWQSLKDMPAEYFKRFEAYICDEAHGADSKCITSIINSIGPRSKFRMGTTGTLDGTKMHEREMQSRFGSTIHRITTKQLMDLGLVARLSIECYKMSYPEDECRLVKDLKKYDAEIKYIVNHAGRNEWIAEKVANRPGNTLVLFNFIEHGERLVADITKAQAGTGRSVYMIHGKVKQADRNAIKKLMEQETGLTLVASYGCLSTGVSIKNIDTVVFAHPFKDRILNLQSIGRGLRLRAGKTGVTLIDIGDDFSIMLRKNMHRNHLYKHFVKRLEIYEDEEFDYEIFEVVHD